MLSGKELTVRYRSARHSVDHLTEYEITVCLIGLDVDKARSLGEVSKKDKADGGDGLFYFVPTDTFCGIDFDLGPFRTMKALQSSLLSRESKILSRYNIT